MTDALLERFHRVLVTEIRTQRPDYLTGPFTVAEIYQNLVPYGSHRDRIGVEMNGDYEDALVRLLAGEGDYLVVDSEPALRDLRAELQRSNPNTGVYREYAAVDVRLNRDRVDPDDDSDTDIATDVERGDEVASGDPSRSDLVSDLVEEPSSEASSAPLDPGPIRVLPPGVDVFSPFDEGAVDPGGVEPRGSVARPPLAPEYVEPGGDPETEGGADPCPSCGSGLPQRDALRFCPFCGIDIRLTPCTSCGEAVEPGWRFCIACGADVPA